MKKNKDEVSWAKYRESGVRTCDSKELEGMEFSMVPVVDIYPAILNRPVTLDGAFLESVRLHGVCQPLHCEPPDSAGMYRIIAGERRWRAACEAGHDVVPVLVVQGTEQGRRLLQLTENIMREELHPLDAGLQIMGWMDAEGVNCKQVAAVLGVSKSWVEQRVRVASSISGTVLEMGFRQGVFCLRVAVALHGLPRECWSHCLRDLEEWCEINGTDSVPQTVGLRLVGDYRQPGEGDVVDLAVPRVGKTDLEQVRSPAVPEVPEDAGGFEWELEGLEEGTKGTDGTEVTPDREEDGWEGVVSDLRDMYSSIEDIDAGECLTVEVLDRGTMVLPAWILRTMVSHGLQVVTMERGDG
jgi:hypothetical protein